VGCHGFDHARLPARNRQRSLGGLQRLQLLEGLPGQKVHKQPRQQLGARQGGLVGGLTGGLTGGLAALRPSSACARGGLPRCRRVQEVSEVSPRGGVVGGRQARRGHCAGARGGGSSQALTRFVGRLDDVRSQKKQTNTRNYAHSREGGGAAT
jgi:hypothetical protein